MKTTDVRLDQETLARIDTIQRERSRRENRKVTRSEVLRSVVGAGLPLQEEQLSKRDADADVPEQAQATSPAPVPLVAPAAPAPRRVEARLALAAQPSAAVPPAPSVAPTAPAPSSHRIFGTEGEP
jgi:hypothetical protein